MKTGLSKDEKKRIGSRIREHLQKNAILKARTKDRTIISTPSELAHSAGVAQSTIFKLHSGEFSMKTLRIVEAILEQTFSEEAGGATETLSAQTVPVFSGGYTRVQIEPYLGTFLTVRQGMAKPENLLTTLVHITWDDDQSIALFSETNKFVSSEGKDYDYSQSGSVHISNKINLIHLLTTVDGALRLITLTRLQVMEPVMYGAILTQIPEAGAFIPTKASVHFRKIEASDGAITDKDIGVISPQHSRYQSLLDDLDEARRATMAR